ncbi:hypothetical protein MIND_00995100 [Mycena indigotica]|uniref:F-box domain-containing protein n=1 Tax=Mycena indigotica TaxID=2126181 RepID=A0A8H6VWK8_9AGAR|nr:uncharacterized protein MIND_00995100 [Mycena indigotica]KAF7294586.1 hypothetical protein MIND_00995100 [Mycena indigotica]
MILSELPTEVIVEILLCCDVFGVINIGETCKHLHEISCSKSVWISLIIDLKLRGVIDGRLVPQPTQLSLSELVGLAQRVLHGPKSWRPLPGAIELTPEVLRYVSLGPCTARPAYCRLLPDGRHFLLNNDGTLECWEVERNQRVWQSPLSKSGLEILSFALEQNELGVVMIAATCLQAGMFANASRAPRVYVDVSELDLRNLDNIIHTQHQLYPGGFDVLDLTVLAVSGDLVLFHSIVGGFLLIDWRTGTAGFLKAHHRTFKLALGATFMAMLSETRLRFFDTASLRSHLSVVDPDALLDSARIVFLEELRPFLKHRLQSPVAEPTSSTELSTGGLSLELAIYVYPNPLAHGTYRIWLVQSATNGRSPKVSYLHRLSLVYPPQSPSTPPVLYSTQSAPSVVSSGHAAQISFSGHSVAAQRSARVDAAAAASVVDRHHVQGQMELVHLPRAVTPTVALYSGALTYLEYATGKVTIVYYV